MEGGGATCPPGQLEEGLAGAKTAMAISPRWPTGGSTRKPGRADAGPRSAREAARDDGDNEITLADFGILSGAFGLVLGDVGFDANADQNGNDEVDLADFGILSSNFGEVGD